MILNSHFTLPLPGQKPAPAAAPPEWVGEAISWMEGQINTQNNAMQIAVLKGCQGVALCLCRLDTAAFERVLAQLYQLKRGGS